MKSCQAQRSRAALVVIVAPEPLSEPMAPFLKVVDIVGQTWPIRANPGPIGSPLGGFPRDVLASPPDCS
jgi:hypothetical protein